ncbi:MAG: K+/H+ antiporter [Planctomycetes bacterium GWF2_50_10]|nr:MAG: K+/H+ antiporter [Planctomycetes bacterium GWF2_50_10]
MVLGHNISIELIIIVASGLLLLSLLATNVSGRFGIPALLAFLALGMLAGSDGPGGIYFDNPWLAQVIGVIALIFIIFGGGFDTRWNDIKPILRPGLILSTLGVLLTALIVGIVAHRLTDLTFKQALLLGAIVSSTDAAAVFAVLRSRNVSLRPSTKSLLEFESGSNDPMAIFLTIVMTAVVAGKETTVFDFAMVFLRQMVFGLIFGFLAGKALLYLIRKIKFDYDGLYPVLTMAAVALTYALTSYLGSSGFLAVYVMGLYLGKADFIHKRNLISFHEGLAWLMQITMFLTLGLLVFPSQLPSIMFAAIAIALALIFIARPLSVFALFARSRFSLSEKTLVSWVGLRGAVPIVLATFPLIAHVPRANIIFDIVFFVVLTSTLIQGPTIPYLARLLKLDLPIQPKTQPPIQFERTETMKADLLDILVPKGSNVIGKQLKDLSLPEDVLIVLINRDNIYLVPKGSTTLEEADIIFALVDSDAAKILNAIVDEGVPRNK